MTPLPAVTALDAYFLEARCKLLDVAAILDRIHRGATAEDVKNDPRLSDIARAVQVLAGSHERRAEAIQQIFSLEYDAAWPIPTPK